MNEQEARIPVQIGVDVGGTKILAVLSGRDGQVFESVRHPTAPERGADTVIDEITDSVKQLLQRTGRTGGTFANSAAEGNDESAVSIGLGIAGQIDTVSGTLLTSPNIQWQELALKSELEKELNLPVFVTNDVRAAAFAEWKFGAGQDIDNLVCLFIGTGVGAGIVSAGRMLEGDRSPAAELGHVSLVFDGRKCSCRNRGCLEAYVGGWAIAERAEQALTAARPPSKKLNSMLQADEGLTAKDVGEAFRDGDMFAKQIIAETSQYLAAALVGIVNTFNPRRIVLGGGVVEGVPELLDPLQEYIDQHALAAFAEGLEIKRAVLGSAAGAIGAAELGHRAAEGKEQLH